MDPQMSEKKIVFVVGAGASCEVGLPSGKDLKDKIASLLINIEFENIHTLNGDKLICDALQKRALKIHEDENPHWPVGKRKPTSQLLAEPYAEKAQFISRNMTQAKSIDNFLNSHHSDLHIELCGKLAIVRKILQEEGKSSLRSKLMHGTTFQDLEETWFTSLWMLLTDCKKEDLSNRLSSVAFIVFNYDRCLEHFLYHSFQKFFNFSPNQAAELVKGIEIYHPYGVAGELPYNNNSERRVQFIDFGEEPETGFQLLHLANQIKTFTQGYDSEATDIVSIRNCMANAEKVVFLGFAFNDQNLRLIQPKNSKTLNPHTRYIGTAYGISESDCEIIRSKLSQLNGIDVENIALGRDLKCVELFQEYNLTLSFA